MRLNVITNIPTKIKSFLRQNLNFKPVQTIKGHHSLRNDVIEISNGVRRWQNPQTDYTPRVFEGTEAPSHHYINGYNSAIRDCFEKISTLDNFHFFKNMRFMSKKKFLKIFQHHIDNGIIQRRIKTAFRIDKEFAQLPPLEKDCIVYRGRFKPKWDFSSRNADFNIIKKAKTGDIIIPDRAYSYCAFNRSFAETWGKQNKLGCETIMYTIRIPKGAKVSRNLEHGGEIVMPRNAQYKVISKNKKNNHTEIVLEYQLPTKDNLLEIKTLAERFNISL